MAEIGDHKIELTLRDNRLLRYAIEARVQDLEHDIEIFWNGPNDRDEREYNQQEIIDLWNLCDKLQELYVEAIE